MSKTRKQTQASSPSFVGRALGLSALLCLASAACAIEPVADGMDFGAGGPGTPLPPPDGGPQTGDDGDPGTSDDDDADTGGATGNDSGQDEATSDGGTDEADTGDAGGTDEGQTDTGDGGTAGGTDTGGPDGSQPEDGMWSHCDDIVGCSVGGCITNDDHSNGFCTQQCYSGDPNQCPPPPGGDATRTCIAVVGLQICALDCAGGKACPTGMDCLGESDDNGPREICV